MHSNVVNTHILSEKPEFRPKSDFRALSSRAHIPIPALAARSRDGCEMVLSGGLTINGGLGGGPPQPLWLSWEYELRVVIIRYFQKSGKSEHVGVAPCWLKVGRSFRFVTHTCALQLPSATCLRALVLIVAVRSLGPN